MKLAGDRRTPTTQTPQHPAWLRECETEMRGRMQRRKGGRNKRSKCRRVRGDHHINCLGATLGEALSGQQKLMEAESACANPGRSFVIITPQAQLRPKSQQSVDVSLEAKGDARDSDAVARQVAEQENEKAVLAITFVWRSSVGEQIAAEAKRKRRSDPSDGPSKDSTGW